MNKWKVFHWLQDKPDEVCEAVAKGWHGIEYREPRRINVNNCEYAECDPIWKDCPGGWYGFEPDIPLGYRCWEFQKKLIIED